MDITKEGSLPEVKEFHIECSWIPTTPAKPVLSKLEPIYADSQENQLGQANWSESERFFQGNQIDQVNCLESERYKPGESTCCDSTCSIIDLNKDFEMPFADLFALADAATATTTCANKTQCVNNSPEGNRFQSGSANTSLSDQHSLLGSNLCSASDRPLGIPHYGGSTPCRLTYDLNLPPRTITNAGSSMVTTPKFAPVTPHQAKSVENKQVSDIQNTTVHERTNQAKEAHENEVVTTRVEVSKQHHEKEQPHQLEEFSCEDLSPPLEENHNPDKGVDHGIDLNKTPQQKPRRKKHRPKVVIEGQPNKTRKPTNPAGENPTGKRKYVRRNGRLNKPTSTPSAGVTSRPTNPNTVGNMGNSCKRSLNFDFESQAREKRSSPMHFSTFSSESQAQNFFTRVPSKSTVQLGQGIEVMVEKTEMGIAYDLTRSVNEVLEDYISMPERQSPSTPSPTKTHQPYEKLKDETTNECSRGKCLTVVENETDDKQDNIGEGVTYTDSQSAPRGRKRAHSCVIDEAQLTNVTVKGPYHNSLQAYFMFPVKQYYNQFLGIHFPASCKKKRTGKARNSAKSITLSTVTAAENCERRATMCPLNNTSSIHNKQQTFACMLALSHTKRLTKKRWKGTTRVRDLSSLIRIMKCKQQPTSPARGAPTSGNRQGFEVSHQPHTCMEALLADTHMKMATKKRSRRNYFVNSVPPSTYGHRQSFGRAKGPPPVAIWKNMSPIAAVVERLKHLDINGASNKVEHQVQNALVPYNLRYREQNTLVLYRRDGTVVPFERSFDPVKKRRARAKVELDEETNRVWKLLLENINSEGIDGTDEEKAKWWEEERNVFRGRADSFIARMHLVLGDRRFSKWKGSVVDSVIGVFLTQNVSDHLSSSAFMSLAARFPLKSKSKPRPSSPVKWDDEDLSHPLCDQNSGAPQDVAYNEEREVLNSNETFGSNTGGVRSTNNSECELFGYSESVETNHEAAVNRSTTQITETVASFTGDERETDSVLSSQNSVNSSIVPTTDGSLGNSEDLKGGSRSKMFGGPTSFAELLQISGTMIPRVCNHVSEEVSPYEKDEHNQAKSTGCDSQEEKESIPSINNIDLNPNSGANDVGYIDMLEEESTSSDFTKENEENLTGKQSELMAESISQPTVQETVTESFQCVPTTSSQNSHACNNIESQIHEHNCQRQKVQEVPNFSEEILDVTESTSITENPRNTGHKTEPNFTTYGYFPHKTDNGISASTSKEKRGRMGKEKQNTVDWDSLRKQAQVNGKKRERTRNTMDSVDWEAVRCADVDEIANTIRERGMNHMLAERIKDFLNRLVREHESIDLEWLRDVPPDKAKEYLLSVRGLGLKSVECVRLLTLHHLAFPVDTNVGRIAVRLGWVPLQPLPESLQLHLLELYPVLESIQKYLWPRLCKLDQRTLYELHYQMITFGKVFCTKSKPNCNACPMRGECRHFASAFASARLALPGPEEKSIICVAETKSPNPNPMGIITQVHLSLPQPNQQLEAQSEIKNSEPVIEVPASPKPIIEEPETPEPEHTHILESDIEDTFCEDPEEIPTIRLNIKEFTQNLQNYMQQNMELEEGDMSKALVALTPEAASIPMPKLKNVSRLRTEHQVYELPDSHPLLEGLDNREPDDPSSYLLALWTPGETANSIHQPEIRCNSQEFGELCDENTCLSCNSIREANSQTVRGTLLIPCRTAMRGSFPLNGTYFQVNEVFADHESSINPIDVPRAWIWNLPRRTVYFGTSIPTIFKGLSTEGIQYCFWRGFVCVRGFDQKTRAPRPLMARLHFPVSKLVRTNGRNDDK